MKPTAFTIGRDIAKLMDEFQLETAPPQFWMKLADLLQKALDELALRE
jgi:hypothetical protein